MPAAPKSAAPRSLCFSNDNSTLWNRSPVGNQPGSERIRRIDAVEVIEIPADDPRMEPRPDKLRQKYVRQAHEPVARKQLATNLDSRPAQLVDPTHQCGMRDSQILCQLFPGHGERHVLHQSKDELVELTVHGLFRSHAQMDIDCGYRVSQRTDRDVIDTGFREIANGIECDSAR